MLTAATKMTREYGWDHPGIFKEEPLDPFELSVYDQYMQIRDSEKGVTPSNREIARRLSTEENKISRNAVARARRRIAHKLDFKAGW